MKIFLKVIVLIFVVLNLLSCVSVTQGEKLLVGLKPVHKTFTALESEGKAFTHLVDNDGNLYISYWTVGQYEIEIFKAAAKKCRSDLKYSLFANRPPLINTVTIDSVRPSNFKKFVSCVSDEGYGLISSDGFYPQGFKLHVNRSHSYRGHYMPVGGGILIDTKIKQYSTMLSTVQQCDESVRQKMGNPVVEKSFRGYTHVSIENYIEELMTCVEGKPYKLKNNIINSDEELSFVDIDVIKNDEHTRDKKPASQCDPRTASQCVRPF